MTRSRATATRDGEASAFSDERSITRNPWVLHCGLRRDLWISHQIPSAKQADFTIKFTDAALEARHMPCLLPIRTDEIRRGLPFQQVRTVSGQNWLVFGSSFPAILLVAAGHQV
ncbi:MAG: hypothetical protein ACK5LJ_09335 [Paracoccus sp. (in: a-proteobacteria)]